MGHAPHQALRQGGCAAVAARPAAPSPLSLGSGATRVATRPCRTWPWARWCGGRPAPPGPPPQRRACRSCPSGVARPGPAGQPRPPPRRRRPGGAGCQRHSCPCLRSDAAQLTEPMHPGQQLPVAGAGGRELLGAKQAAVGVDHCGDMDILVRVDPADDIDGPRCCHCDHPAALRGDDGPKLDASKAADTTVETAESTLAQAGVTA